MSEAKDNNKKPARASRAKRWVDRYVIPVAMVGGMAGGGIGGGVLLHRWHQSYQDTARNQNKLPPLKQEQVDKEYARLFDEISAAKKTADEAGKKLVILLGENHASAISNFYNIMIADIASRIGIKDMVREWDDVEEKGWHKQASLENSEAVAMLVAALHDLALSGKMPASSANKPVELSQADQKKMTSTMITALIAVSGARAHDQRITQEVKRYGIATSHTHCDDTYYNQLGFTHHYGDTQRHDNEKITQEISRREKEAGRPLTIEEKEGYLASLSAGGATMRGRYSEIVENAMVKAVCDVPAPAIASYGSAHLPVIFDGLSDHKELLVLPYDIGSKSVASDVRWSEDAQNQKRMEQVDALVAEGKVHRPNITARLVSNESATYMALMASTQHKARKGEITKDIAEAVARLLPAVMGYDAPTQGRGR